MGSFVYLMNHLLSDLGKVFLEMLFTEEMVVGLLF